MLLPKNQQSGAMYEDSFSGSELLANLIDVLRSQALEERCYRECKEEGQDTPWFLWLVLDIINARIANWMRGMKCPV